MNSDRVLKNYNNKYECLSMTKNTVHRFIVKEIYYLIAYRFGIKDQADMAVETMQVAASERERVYGMT